MWLEDKREIKHESPDKSPSKWWEVVENTKSSLFDLMYGRVIDDAYYAFLRYYEKLPEDEVEVKEFEKKLEEFKMVHPTIRHVLY